MHEDELWQEYGQNGEPLENGGRPSSFGNPTGDEKSIIGIAIVIVVRKVGAGDGSVDGGSAGAGGGSDGGGLEILWQERGPNVDNAGKWDLSAGGHVNYGETTLTAARREAAEEIGLNVADDRLFYAYSIAQNPHRFCWTYVYDYTGLPDDFHFDDGEVAQVKWVPYSDLPEFLQKYAKEHVAKDKLFFKALEGWLKLHGYLDK